MRAPGLVSCSRGVRQAISATCGVEDAQPTNQPGRRKDNSPSTLHLTGSHQTDLSTCGVVEDCGGITGLVVVGHPGGFAHGCPELTLKGLDWLAPAARNCNHGQVTGRQPGARAAWLRDATSSRFAWPAALTSLPRSCPPPPPPLGDGTHMRRHQPVTITWAGRWRCGRRQPVRQLDLGWPWGPSQRSSSQTG